MTTGTLDASLQPMALLSFGDDPTFGFKTTEWVDPPSFNKKPSETDEERKVRICIEKDYKNVTDRTFWHRYSTLGRCVVDGHTFDKIMLSIDTDHMKAHCLIWYQYMYTIDRKLDMPAKLKDWATKMSMAYLAIHSPGLLLLDTLQTPWQVLLREQSLASDEWTTVEGKSRKNKKNQSSPTHARHRPPPIPTITEESNESELETPKASPVKPSDNSKPVESHDVSKSSSAGAPSVLIPNSRVPMNDGTNRITFRWKATIDFHKVSSQSSKMNDKIYSFLNDIFFDDDGHLYQWGIEGVDKFKLISGMSPAEVRSYICPSSTIIPDQSLIILPIRFGFSNPTPAAWRNKPATKETLEQKGTTVAISNSSSTSGKLAIAGYILLKAPMTTHRIRYLQALRRKLPVNTPSFDILLHKRTPLD